MRKIYTTLSLVLAFTITAFAGNGTFSWFLGGGGATGSDYASDVATDKDGNVFFSASFLSSSTFNGQTQTGSAKGSGTSFDKSLFITKLNSSKTSLWNIYSNVGVFNPIAIATTPSGDLIVTGSVRAVKGGATDSANIVDAAGTSTYFPDLGYNAGDAQTVVAKFNSNGIIQWVKELNSSATKDTLVETTGLATDASGNIYLTGIFTKTVVFPASTPISLTTTNTIQAAFVAKLDGATGNAVWAKTSSGGVITENLNAITVGSDGNIYVAGSSKNLTTPVTVTFGDKTFTPSITPSLVLIKLLPDGTVSYVQSRAALSTDATKGDLRIKDLVYSNGKVFIAGSFQGSYGGIAFTGGPIVATAAYLNGLITSFNAADGTDAWYQAITAPAITEVNGLALGADGKLWAHGYTYNALGTNIAAGDCVFGNSVVLTDATNKLGDLFLTSFDPANGSAIEAHWAGKGTGSETANALASYGANLYLASTTNSNPLTFETATSSYARYGSFDFVLQSYTVATTGIKPVQSNSISSYYDAASRSIVVKDASNYSSISIYSLLGQKVGTSTVNNAGEVRFENLQKGVYLIGATQSTGSRTSLKVSVQ